MKHRTPVVALVLLGGFLSGWARAAEKPASLAWPAITSESRPWAYWWWMASAVNPDDLTSILQQCQAAGMGGLHIIPIYGARGYEAQYIDYLTPQWLAMLRHSIDEANRLGMGIDMTTGTGWCFGGPKITDELSNASVVFARRPLKPGEPIVVEEMPSGVQAIVATGGRGESVDLTKRFNSAGKADWTAPGDGWELVVVSQRPSGRKVKRAAPGGAGWMLNPFYGRAVKTYLAGFDEALAGYDGPMPRAMYHDSFEYVSDWSPNLFDEFERRRGYRLEGELAALLGRGTPEHIGRVKCDYRETISDMMIDDFLGTWVPWANKKGCRTRNQAHGSPGNLLDLYAAADIPETEMFRLDRDPLVAKFASSAAHTAGRTLVAAETGTWLDEHFTVTLAKLKRLVDELFVSGVNHVIYHGNCYSPADAPWPGWCFYASTEMNPRNAFWHDVPALNAYIARCQAVLQSGTPSSELLVYWPIHDYWSSPEGMTQNMTVHHTDWLVDQPVGEAARWLWQQGYTFDYVSDRQLAETQVAGNIVATKGAAYRAVLVPSCRRIPTETLRQLVKLANNGATVIFEGRLPGDVPGLYKLEDRRRALAELLSGVKQPEGGDDAATSTIGDGKILVGSLESTLAAAGVERESMVDGPGVAFIRRRHRNGYHYFVANSGDEAIDGWLPLAKTSKSVLIMDPMTGEIGLADTKPDGHGTLVRMRLPVGEAIVLRTFDTGPIAGPHWPHFTPTSDAIELSGRWRVEFIQGGPELPAAFETDRLVSWTEQREEAERFAGTARYTLRFDAPAGQADGWLLDLGRVAESARVRFNGRDLGTRIMAPFSVRVDALKPTDNVLEVEVTNLSANRIRDLDRRKVPWRIFHDINFVNIDYKPFDASSWPVRESGLLGPVRLIPVAREGQADGRPSELQKP